MSKNMIEIKEKMFNIVRRDGSIRLAGVGYLYSVNVFSGKSNEEMHWDEMLRMLYPGEGEKLVLVSEKSYGIGEA